MRGQFVCLLVCLSVNLSVCHLSGTFGVAWSWTPTVAFESLGLRYWYVCPHLSRFAPHLPLWAA